MSIVELVKSAKLLVKHGNSETTRDLAQQFLTAYAEHMDKLEEPALWDRCSTAAVVLHDHLEKVEAAEVVVD